MVSPLVCAKLQDNMHPEASGAQELWWKIDTSDMGMAPSEGALLRHESCSFPPQNMVWDNIGWRTGLVAGVVVLAVIPS